MAEQNGASTENLNKGPDQAQNSGNDTNARTDNSAAENQDRRMGAGEEPAKFQGKSREDIIRSYTELERLATTKSDQVSQFIALWNHIGGLYDRDPESGVITYNKDALKQVAIEQGIFPEGPTDNQKPDEGNDDYEEKPKREQDMSNLREEIRKALREEMAPLSQTVQRQQVKEWIHELKTDQNGYPDIEKYRSKMAELISAGKGNLNSKDGIKDAYLLAKASSGDFVDKSFFERHQAELRRLIQHDYPGANAGPETPPNQQTNAELLGLDMPRDKNSEAAQILTGKPFLL
jgi:hypothetical protein